MPITRAAYAVAITLPLDHKPLLHGDVYETPIVIAPDLSVGVAADLVTLTLRPGRESKLVVEIEWLFDELFSDDPDAKGETLLSLMERFPRLLLPKDAFTARPPRQFPIVETALALVAPAIASIAVRGRSPELLKAFGDARYARAGEGTLHVAGKKLPVKAVSHYTRRPVDPVAISLADVTAAVDSAAPAHEAFVAQADARLLDGDLRGAITSLANAMEMAAYTLEHRESDASPVGAFAPKKYFAASKDAPPSVVAYVERAGPMEPAIVDKLESLWGTRNEIVRNGLLKVRPARPNAPAATWEDYYAFRAALSAGFAWMGFRAIE